MRRPKLLLANHFDLTTVCGTTVMFAEVLRLAPRCAPDVQFAYLSYERHASAGALRRHLDEAHRDAACMVAVNAHIEVRWDLSEALFRWCREREVPAYLYAHDYWPQHKPAMQTLIAKFGARVIASTAFVAEQIEREGFPAGVVEVGVPLPDTVPPAPAPASPKIIACAGRLVPRKRLADVVRGFAASGLDGTARLYVRALPSNVFSPDADTAQLAEMREEIGRHRLTGVVIDRKPGAPPDYLSYAAYVCSSSYEGFSMTVIEAAFHGCPPLMSDIPPHQRTARALFGDAAEAFLYPAGDWQALGRLLRDEVPSSRRRTLISSRLDDIRSAIRTRFGLGQTAGALARLALSA